MRLIVIGRIYLLKSSEAERRHTARWRSSETASPCRLCQNSAQKQQCTIRNLAGQQEYHAYVSVLLRKGAFKVFRFQSAPRRRPLAFTHAQNALSHLPVSKTLLQACMHPKRLSCSLEPKAALRDCLHPGHSFALAEPKATLCVGLYPNRPLEPACAQSPSCPPESKAALRGCLNPRLPFTITRIQSHSCHLGSKDPPRVRPSLKHPSCSPKS